MRFAVLFPGQGSQFVGMGEDLFDEFADLLDETADDILGWSLRGMCLHGPEDELTRTEHAQPALFALSYALWTALARDLSELPAGAAGHSLGEYTALAAAGALDYEMALGLVAERGRAMADAAGIEPSGMAALIGATVEEAESIAVLRRSEGGRLEVANLNAPGQVVVAGSLGDITWLVENARRLGVRRAIPLKVAGAFHSSFMAPAADALRDTISRALIHPTRFPVWANTTARPHADGSIGDELVRQLVSPVRFEESLRDMGRSGIEVFVHVGPGEVTAGMASRTVDAVVEHVSSLADVGRVTEALSTMTRPEES